MANKNRLYPHLLPDDIEVWERFLAEHRNDYLYFDYDIRVGRGRDPGPDYDPNIRQMGLDLSKRRIDAIGYQANFIHIIEITTRIGIRALGQVSLYPVLYALTFKPLRPLRTVIVASEVGTDVMPAINRANIILHLFPD